MAQPDKIINIDGNLTLDQIRDACIVEQNSGYQLQSIENATLPQNGLVLRVNKSEYLANLDFLPALLFVEPGANDPETIKTQKQAQGWTFLCSGAIYVQDNITNVMVFGQ
jgi:hypothetical protein